MSCQFTTQTDLTGLHVVEAEAQHPVALLAGGLVEDLLGMRAVGAAVAERRGERQGEAAAAAAGAG